MDIFTLAYDPTDWELVETVEVLQLWEVILHKKIQRKSLKKNPESTRRK
jgi:hypothetical protein